VAATSFRVLAGVAVRFWSRRAVLTTGLALIGVAMASLTLISPSTAYPQLGIALFVVGVGLGLAYTVANDVILASVRPERAGAAAAISETAYELGMALGIAMLGSIVADVYRGLAIPPGILDAVAAYAKETLGTAHLAAGTLPADKAHALLTAARSAFAEGLAIAAGVGSALLLASAVIVWLLLTPHPVAPALSEERSGSLRRAEQYHTGRYMRPAELPKSICRKRQFPTRATGPTLWFS
jgi:MFS transporter, DHA2 family, multidrug resistance protein